MIRLLLKITLLVVLIAGCGDSGTGPDDGERIDLTVYLTDENGFPLGDAIITTIPATHEVETDMEGKAVFVDIIDRAYFFVIELSDIPPYQYYFTMEDANPDSFPIMVVSKPPDVMIQFPLADNILGAGGARFIAEASDHEDGALPDSAMVWMSDRDGVLGRGDDISDVELSPGEHIITFTATDSQGKSMSDIIGVTVAEYSSESYFPLVNDAEWIYNHGTNEFIMYDYNNVLERWVLKNITVSIGQDNRRTSIMEYQATTLSRTRHYRYKVVDDLEKTGDDVRVTRTLEDLQIWQDEMQGLPNEHLLIDTEYDNGYDIFRGALAPQFNSSYSFTATGTSVWTYVNKTTGTTEFTESVTFPVTVSIGEPGPLDEMFGTVTALPLTITEGNGQRKWWLVRGFGLVRLQYNTYDVDPIATLIRTNLANEMATTMIGKPATGRVGDSVIIEDMPVSGIDRMRSIRNVLHSMAPR